MKHYNEDQFFEYFDDQLSDTERRALESHVDECADCKSAFQAVRSFSGAFANAYEPEPSENFVQNVMAQLLPAKEPTPSRRLLNREWLFPAFQLAFSLAVFFAYTGNKISAPSSRQITISQGDEVEVDTQMVLLSGLPSEINQEDFTPLPFNLSTALGISTEGI